METSIRSQLFATSCPECRSEIKLPGRVLIGEVFGCGSCGAQLEIANTDPLTLEPLAKVEEDEEDFRGFSG